MTKTSPATDTAAPVGAEQIAAPGAARAPRSWRRRVLTVLGTLLACYLVLATMLTIMQEHAIFPGAYWLPDNLPREVNDPRIQQIWRSAPDGLELEAWLYAPAAEQPRPAVVVFHGNGEFVDYRWGALAPYRDAGYVLLVPEYRGYGRMDGYPSEAALQADMEGWIEWLRARPEVDPQRIIYHGISLGGGVAGAIIDTHPPAALVLQSTFKSVASFSARYGLPQMLCRHPFRTMERLANYAGPVFIQHGTDDGVIPVAHGRALHEASPQSVYHEHGGDHNYVTLWEELFDFLADHDLGPPGPVAP